MPVVRERAAEGLSVTGSWNNPPFVPSEGLYECAPSLQTSQMESQRASDRKYSKPHKSLQARPRLAYLRFGFRVAWRSKSLVGYGCGVVSAAGPKRAREPYDRSVFLCGLNSLANLR